MSSKLPSFAATRELKTLGKHLSIARRRRKMSQKRLAAGAAVSVRTIQLLEKGVPGVSIGTVAMVLQVLGIRGGLSRLVFPGEDEIGLLMSIDELPQRVKEKKRPAVETGTEVGNTTEVYMEF